MVFGFTYKITEGRPWKVSEGSLRTLVGHVTCRYILEPMRTSIYEENFAGHS